MKLPITKAGKNIAKHIPKPYEHTLNIYFNVIHFYIMPLNE